MKNKVTNVCEKGYCTLYLNQESIKNCLSQQPKKDRYHGCSYGNGEPVNENVQYELKCCENGCTMSAARYVEWNGLCAYQGN